MANQKNESKKKKQNDEEELLKPDKEKNKGTDPQDEMEGPVSSLMQGMKNHVEKNDKETKEEADKIKDENT